MYVYWLTSIIEGPWDRVHQVIGQAHTILHQQGIVRIQTDIRVGSRCVFIHSFLLVFLVCLLLFWGLLFIYGLGGVWVTQANIITSSCLQDR